MTELIIIKTNKSQEIKAFLEKERINYEIYQTSDQVFSNKSEEEYWRKAVREASQDKERQKEVKAWDKVASKIKA